MIYHIADFSSRESFDCSRKPVWMAQLTIGKATNNRQRKNGKSKPSRQRKESMRLKTSIQIIVARTALVLIQTFRWPKPSRFRTYRSQVSKPRYGSARKRAPLGEINSRFSSSTCREAR